MTTMASALIPQYQAKRTQCKEAHMLVILDGEQFPEKVFRRLARRHNAESHHNPHTNEMYIAVPYHHDRAESALGMLANAGIKVERSHVSRESIAAVLERFKTLESTAPEDDVLTAIA